MNISAKTQATDHNLDLFGTLIPLYSGLSSTALYVTLCIFVVIILGRRNPLSVLKNFSFTLKWKPPTTPSAHLELMAPAPALPQ